MVGTTTHDVLTQSKISSFVDIMLRPDPAAKVPVHFVGTDNACRSYSTMRQNIPTVMQTWRNINKKNLLRYNIKSIEVVGDDSVTAHNGGTSKRLRIKFTYHIRVLNDDGSVKSDREFDELTFHIPLMYDYHGKIESSDIPDCGNMGGVIPHSQKLNKTINKVIIFALEANGWFPQYKDKNNIFHLVITSREHSFISHSSDKKPQYINIDLSIARDKARRDYKFSIKSEMAIPETDVILLIYFYSLWDIDTIKREITAGFIRKWAIIIEGCIELSFRAIDRSNVSFETVRKKIRADFEIFHNKKNAQRKTAEENSPNSKTTEPQPSFDTYFNQKIFEFLPHIDPNDGIMKAKFLVHCVRILFGHVFAPSAMIDKNNIHNKKLMGPGDQVMAIFEKSFKTLTEKFKKPINERGGISSDFVPRGVDEAPSVEQDITTMLNRRDQKTNPLIRIGDITNPVKAIMLPNRANIHSKLKKVVRPTKSRGFDIFSSGIIWKYETTDSAKYVALTNGLSVGVKNTSETLVDIEIIYNKVCKWITDYIDSLPFENDEPLVTIVIIEACLEPNWAIPQKYIKQFVADFRKTKRRNMFDSLYVSIAAVPGFVGDEVRNMATSDSSFYFSIYVSVSNNRAVRPMLVVTDGVPEISKINIPETEEGALQCQSLLLTEYPDIVEYVDAIQTTYSRVAQSFRDFEVMDKETKKSVDLIDIPETCASYASSMIPDIAHQAPIRIHFAAEKSKHHMGPALPNVRNKQEAQTVLITGNRPLLTNSVQINSQIHAAGTGNYCLTAYMSYAGNIEDGITVNEDSLNRGLLAAYSYILENFDDIPGQKMVGPDPQRYIHNYTGINSKGYREPTTVVKNKDAMFRNTNEIFSKSDRLVSQSFDSSEEYKNTFPGYIDRVTVIGSQKKRLTYVILQLKLIAPGDKVSQVPQKKVVIKVMPAEEMPLTEQGVRVDVVCNATCLADRQTYSLVNHMILTNALAINSVSDDGERYVFMDIPTISPEMKPRVYENMCRNIIKKRMGSDIPMKYIRSETRMFNPVTLRPYKDFDGNDKYFLVSMAYITRCPQIAQDKVSVRNRGHYTKTMDAPAGKMGGTKLGYMEIDNLMSSGAGNCTRDFLQEPRERRLMTMHCLTCGGYARRHKNESVDTWRCDVCPFQRFVSVEAKYTAAIYNNIHRSMGILAIPIESREPVYKKKIPFK